MAGALGRTLRFIRFSHTIFAMPFALGAMLVAARGLPPWRLVGWVALAMALARTAAMCFNRVADWEIDQRNPRTADRHTLISRGGAIALLVASAAAFVATTWFINRLCFLLAPVALAIVFFYSLTKRFTSFSHFVLGLALSVSPVGAWLAVRGRFEWPPLVLALAVLLWVAGFDMIYATMDEAFDRAAGLHSWPVKRGAEGALRWAIGLHVAMFGVLAGFGWLAGLRAGFCASLLAVAGALFYEHRVARRRDIGAVNRAFFNANAVVGVAFVLGVALDVIA
ncbi:MAG: UbiA-like polyprenyltransferase [Chthoniobacteraceae bacterium]